MTVQALRDLVSAEQSLEGALGRARKALSAAGVSIVNADPVVLASHAAYKVTTNTTGVVMFVFYRQNIAVLVTMVNVPAGRDDLVASTFDFGP